MVKDSNDEQCRGLEATVDAAGMDSFPASDPPAWSATHAGTPASVLPGSEMFHDVVQRLRDDVHLLSDAIGERNDQSPRARQGLDRAASMIEERFHAAGLPVKRRKVNEWASNVEAVVRGAERPAESVVVGAAYDTARGSPGADEGASGVAALVALAHELQGLPLARTVRLVAFAAERPPHAGTEGAGSQRYLDEVRREGIRVVAMVNLDALGIYRPKERRWAIRRIPALRADLALVGDRRARPLLARARRTLDEREPDVETTTIALPAMLTGLLHAGNVAFAKAGIPALRVIDTAALWPLSRDREGDTADKLDYERLGRTTRALGALVKELAGAAPIAA